MNENLRNHVEQLFSTAPKTKQVIEIKEEILQNTTERYNDLLSEGKTEEAAFNIAVAGIGDIEQLLKSVGTGNVQGYTREEIEKDRKKSAALLAIAIMLYIISIIPLLLCDSTGIGENTAVVMMFSIIAIATGLIIYRANSKLHISSDGNVVDEFKVWSGKKEEQSALEKSLNSVIGSVCLVIYLVVSFITGAWYITWLVFPIAAAVKNVVQAIIELRK